MTRKINAAGLELVKKFEGFYSDAYLCPAGVWTIGYGHTHNVHPGQIITEEEAENLLEQDLTQATADVERLIPVQLTDNQFSALVSFTFNLGATNLQSSTLRRKLNAGYYDDIPAEFNRWVKATDPVTKKKKTLRGLVLRRAAEAALWLTPDEVNTSDPVVAMPQRVDNVDSVDAAAAPTLEQVTRTMNRLGYTIFDGKDRSGRKRNYDLNIFGIRSASLKAGAFDDWIGIFWMNWDADSWEFHIWNATTDPGVYWLEKPMNVRGTAILVEGQHNSCYRIGLHRNKYEALVQVEPMKVYRDDSKDNTLDMKPDTTQIGRFGINLHRASAYRRSTRVGKWSAGCQVIADPRDFARLMDICALSEYEWGPVFSYTLLTQEQLEQTDK